MAKTIELIGDRWTLLILRSALFGLGRFDDFRKELRIPRSVLSRRLDRLVSAGLFRKVPYRNEGSRGRSRYAVTDMGRDLVTAFLAINQWGDHWLREDNPPMTVREVSSRERVRVELVDEADRVVAPGNVGLFMDQRKLVDDAPFPSPPDG